MRYASILLILVFASLYSCNTISPTDLTLDDLVDKKEYTGGIIVDCSSYKGEQVELVLLNGTEQEDPYILELLSAGYYRIEIFLPESGPDLPEVIRIVILDSERGETEWGLPPWTPLEQENGKIADQSVRLIHAPSAPLNLTIPMVVLLNDELNLSELFLDAEIGSSGFRIKRGVGSVQIPANSSQLGLRIDDQNFQLNIDDIDTAPQILSGELSADMQIQAGSYIHIPNDLTIPEGISLSIESGTFLTVAPEVNIYNNGVMQITGTAMAPVTISCSNNEAYWGGFIGNSAGNRLEATHTIFSRSGHHTGGEYAYGHAGRQALFYSGNGELSLDHCYMIDHIGQIFYPVSCTLELNDCLVQRVKTGGQMNQSDLLMDRCVFTDFPNDSFDYQDEDNDGLYLNETNASISNSIFMFAKDDGLDSGASGGGEVLISNCTFEANYHEGAALSSGGSVNKLHRISNSLFTNNGQGLELGYSSPNHRVEVESCRFFRNGIGIRYGDCYETPHHGYIYVANSQSMDNTVYDVWNMNREHWAADTSHMSFENVVVTTPNPMYPELISNE